MIGRGSSAPCATWGGTGTSARCQGVGTGCAARSGRRATERQLTAARERKQRLVDLLVDGTLDRDTYKQENDGNELRISEFAVELAGVEVPEVDLGEALDFATDVLADAAHHWREFAPKTRREFQILLFPDGIHYSPNGRFGTPRTSFLFSGLRAAESGEKKVVAPTGFEPVFLP